MSREADTGLSVDPLQLPGKLRQLVEGELNEGEQLRWVERARLGRFIARSLPLVLIGIPFTGVALLWITIATVFAGSTGFFPLYIFPVFGVPFLLVGGAMLLSPLFMLIKASGTVYAVTDRRAMSFEGGYATTIRSFGPEYVGNLQRTQYADGSGDLIFDRVVKHGRRRRKYYKDVGFLGIANVKQVERLVREISDHRN